MDFRATPSQPAPAASTAPAASVPPAPTRCPKCSHAAAADDLACGLCGELLARPAKVADRFVPPVAPQRPMPTETPSEGDARWGWLMLGVLLAPVLTFTPLLRYVGWFASALFHESGHAAVSWALGCPSIPAISIGGHAAAVHGEQQTFLCLGWMALLAWLGWRARANRAHLVLWAAALVVYPLLAFTGARDAAFLAGGHLGELAVAGIFLVEAITGGVTGGGAERAAHSMLGWYLVGNNAWLAWGLMTSDEARATYHSNGSFGLENDYVRLARDVLGTSLPTVAGLMFVVALAVPVVAILVGRRR